MADCCTSELEILAHLDKIFVMESLLIIGLGLVSGLIGTIAMTTGQYVEIAINKRKSSFTPALIISKVFRFDLEKFDIQAKVRLNNLVHWSYGILWGAILAIIAYFFFELSLLWTAVLYFIVFWIQALIVIPLYGIAPPVWKWEAKWIGIDALHHFVYAIVAAGSFLWLISFF